MATYKHGIYIQEQATSLVPTIEVNAGLPVVIGTAPIHLVEEQSINKATLIYSYSEAVNNFGYNNDWDSFTLCEYMDAAFSKNSISPVVFVNVLDPAKHKAIVASTQKTLKDNQLVLTDPVILSSLVVKKEDAAQPLVKGTDYTAAFDDDGNVLITIIKTDITDSVFVQYDKIDASLVDKDDIIGGVDTVTNKSEGLEVISDIYPLFNLVPGQIVVPK